ncbi:MAG: flavin reductase family protein [Acidobacteriia bacterium]|nr:flavin reductase family protein [Terriglobia bacterium]
MEPEAKKKVLRMINYGMYILSSRAESHLAAATVNWLSQASFTPPLVMVGLKVESDTFATVKKSRHFAVNILGRNQKALAQDFFKPSSVEGTRINGHEYGNGKTGGALLKETPASFECKVTDIVERGDHAVVLGEVVEVTINREDTPLFMRETGWFYGG